MISEVNDMSIFDMGDYNIYVWASVFISFLVLFLAYYGAIKKYNNALREKDNKVDLPIE